jgi:hypothetical protein
MSVKKRSMFKAVAVALAALAVAGSAVAKDDKKKDKKAAEADKKTGGMMEEPGKDPAETETLDKNGAFVPGQQRKEEEAAEAKAAAEAAKPKHKKPAVPRKTWGVFAEGLIGFGRVPLEGPVDPTIGDASTGDGTAFALQVGGHYDFTPAFRLMARVPYTIGTVKSTNGADASTQAIGNPEIAARLRLSAPGDTEWAVRLGVGIPVAQGNPDYYNFADVEGRAQNLLQRIADGGNGWHDPELYALKRIPISPALLFTHRDDRLRVGGDLKLVFMPDLGGDFANSPPTGTLSTPGVAMTVLLGGNVSYEIFTHGHLALAAWARYGIIEQVDYDAPAVTPSHFQLAAEPKFLMQFGHVVPGVGFVIPVGGPLGGDIYGFRAHVDVIF